MGTPQFAVPTLRRLAASDHQILAVVTNPDRPQGRGRQPASPPVKSIALELGLEVMQPASIKEPEFADQLQALRPDLFAVVAFSILPRRLLRIPSLGSVNLHPSLLPAYRGAAPIIWAVINGETETGITTFRLNPRVDAGDLLLQRRVAIDPDETAGELDARLREQGADMMLETIDRLEAGNIEPLPQDDACVSRAPKLTREDGHIDWNQPAAAIRNRIRGTNPVPGAFTEWNGKPLKIHRARLCETDLDADLDRSEPGCVLVADPRQGLVIATGEGGLELSEVQPAGKKSMEGIAFVRGYQIAPGDRFGAPPA